MDTLILGIITFLLVLGPLVILHEFGHFFAAKLTGTKIVEFGFGFPPRAGGKWTGRTPVKITADTLLDLELVEKFELEHGVTTGADFVAQHARVGQLIAFATYENESGEIVARRAALYDDRTELSGDGDLIAGKIKSIEDGTIYISEMLWSFNWLPLGGFVKMVGEEDPTSKNSLASKPRLARVFVLAAGAGVNFVLPFLIFTIVAMIPQNIRVGEVVITAVMPGSPAEEAGLRLGDKIIEVDGRAIENVPALQEAVTLKLGGNSNWDIQRGIPDPFPQPGTPLPAFQYRGDEDSVSLEPRWRPPSRSVVQVVTDPDKELSLVDARIADALSGVSNRLTVVPSVNDPTVEITIADLREIAPGIDYRVGDRLLVVAEVVNPQHEIGILDARRYENALGVVTRLQEGPVGITIRSQNQSLEKRWVWPWFAVGRGAQEVKDLVLLTKNGLTGIIIDSGNPQLEGPATVGPIGIGQLTGEISTADADLISKITTLANLAATLSLSLAVINILPIPALDGGRLFFVIVEALRGGRRVSPEREGLVHLAGMVVLLGLILLISVQDVMRLFRGETFF
ncbi:MAG: site-2 protease family protein [Chloroflexi bacterium]|nr:site-2 protease family protein [Chloroflexota bacterium]